MISPRRRQEIIDALRHGTVPQSSLDAFAVGLERFETALDEELRKVSAGGSMFKAVRGEYGCGKTFFARWLADRARKMGFATTEVQVSETETPLHRLETVYRRLMERLATADTQQGALRSILDGWFFTLEEDVLAEGKIEASDQDRLVARTTELLEQRLARVTSAAPMFSAALRGYRQALAQGDTATADAIVAWLAGQPNVAAGAKRFAGIKGEIDHFGALNFLQGVLTVLRDSGRAGMLIVLDEVETIQRVRSDARDKSLNAIRQLLDEVDSGRFPGLYVLVTGTPSFFEGPQGIQRLEPLAQRLHVDFQTEARFDNPRAVQLRLAAFDLQRLTEVGCKVRDIFVQHSQAAGRVAGHCDDGYVHDLAGAVAGQLGGKVGIAPRIFLKKLVADVLDRVDQFEDFNPRQHYRLTISDAEMTPIERQASGAAGVDDIELDGVSNFERLNSALQHHIVNSLGWRDLRPFQEAVIPWILDGQHMVILAPTAGGKTEAAFFPVLSRMLSEGWRGLSVLYVCPIKALLNNLDVRLQRICSLVGRRSALWHGDVKASARRRITAEPPDCLLTTPESLEVMLVSPAVDERRLFSDLRVVIVDEIHAFAGDDRGWHLLAVLERVTRLAGRELQRIGLSATVGNAEHLSDWLAGPCTGRRQVLAPSQEPRAEADVQLDHVGSLSNAAVVIARLHRGEKRLVFVDSRSRAEQLAAELRQLEVATFVTHSSLSHEQRRQAEEAFASRSDCVIVATSVLELGIDVGDLDRVIHIDSPATVSSFLQRMGRTGRRPDRPRNCLLLATSESALVQAAGLIRLWKSGCVEPAEPPLMPLHIFAQQVMALALQEGGIGLDALQGWIGRVPAFAALDRQIICQIVQFMVERDILWNDNGILWFGRKGEQVYGRRHFMELLSVFTSPPLFSVCHGRAEVGTVHQLSLMTRDRRTPILSLAGRSWKVTHIDWFKRLVHVEPVEAKARTRWLGSGRPLRFELCQAIREVLAEDHQDPSWSKRASEEMNRLRSEFSWVDRNKTAVVTEAEDRHVWWTFAGRLANAAIAEALQGQTSLDAQATDLCIAISGFFQAGELETQITAFLQSVQLPLEPPVSLKATEELKFSACLPQELAAVTIRSRLRDPMAEDNVLRRPVFFVKADVPEA